MNQPLRSHLSRAIAVALVASMSHVAIAQETDTAASSGDAAVTLDNVVVTGSRIRSKNLLSTTPVTEVESVRGPVPTAELGTTLMHEHEVSRIPVLDDGLLVGIVARGDVLRAMVQRRSAE